MAAETADVRIAPPLDWRRALVAFVLTLFVVAALAGGFALGYREAFWGKALPGVSAGGVSLGGLDRQAVEATLRASLPGLTDGRLVLRSSTREESVTFAQLGRAYDYETMAANALAAGRTGDPAAEIEEGFRTLVRGRDLPVVVTYDHAALARAIRDLAGRQDRTPADASAALVGGSFIVTPGADGRAVDQAAAIASADAALGTPGTADVTIDLSATSVAPVITTAEAQAAAVAAEQMTSGGLTFTDAADPSFSKAVTPSVLRTWIAFAATPSGGYQPTVVTAAARAYVQKLGAQVTHPAVDAKYLTGNGAVVGVLAGRDGTQLDATATLAAVSSALGARIGPAVPTQGPSVALAVSTVSPSLTTDLATRTAPLMRLVGTWTTHFVPWEANFWGKNISIPTSKIDGYVVEPGAWFNFWDVVGVPTLADGYGLGGAIINGHTQEQGALGGGICSVSTTLFNAALRAGYEMGERANHYYYIDRYPVGLDATVAMGTGWEQNMTWRNDTAYPVLIRGINATGVVTFQLFSVDPHRTVTFSTPIVKNYTYAGDQTVYVTSIPPGTQNRVEYPANGFDSWVTRTVTDASGTVVHEETYYSHYAVVQGLLQVGVAALPSPSPSPSALPSPGPTPSH